MKKSSRRNVLRNEIPEQMNIGDFPEYLSERYDKEAHMSRAELRRQGRGSRSL